MAFRSTRVASGAALFTLVAAGALLRLVTLGHQSLESDEHATLDVVSRPFRGMLEEVAGQESTPPLFYGLEWAWVKLAGTGEAALRALPAVCGVGFVFVAYLYGRRLAGRAAGLALAAIAAVHPMLIWYSQEARAYSLALLLAGLGWLAFLRVLDEPSRRSVIWWALAAAAAAATQYMALYFFLFQGAWLLASRPAARPHLLVAGAALAGLVVALGPLVAAQADGRSAWIGQIPLGTRLEAAAKFPLAGGVRPTWHPALWIGLAALGGALLSLARADRRRVLLPAGLALGGVGLALLVRQAGRDYFLDQNLIGGWLPLWGVVAAGLARLARPWLIAAATLAVCAPLLAVTRDIARDERLQRPDWRAVAAEIGPARAPRAVLGPRGGYAGPLEHYLRAERRESGVRGAFRDVVAVAASHLPPPPSRPLPGLREVSRRAVATNFLVVRYRASRPVTLDDAGVAAFGLAPSGETLAFVQRAEP